MVEPIVGPPGRFCWHDLAAADVAAALRFYEAVFGWRAAAQAANGGRFMRWRAGGVDVGSAYQLSRTHLERGVPSHWTPYVRVDDIDATARRVRESGGAVVVRPFVVEGAGRIALIEDAVGATLGLWEALPMSHEEGRDA